MGKVRSFRRRPGTRISDRHVFPELMRRIGIVIEDTDFNRRAEAYMHWAADKRGTEEGKAAKRANYHRRKGRQI